MGAFSCCEQAKQFSSIRNDMEPPHFMIMPGIVWPYSPEKKRQRSWSIWNTNEAGMSSGWMANELPRRWSYSGGKEPRRRLGLKSCSDIYASRKNMWKRFEEGICADQCTVLA